MLQLPLIVVLFFHYDFSASVPDGKPIPLLLYAIRLAPSEHGHADAGPSAPQPRHSARFDIPSAPQPKHDDEKASPLGLHDAGLEADVSQLSLCLPVPPL